MTKNLKNNTPIDANDIVRVCLDPTVGSEMRKTRPCLVVETGGSPLDLLIVLPITDGVLKSSNVFVHLKDWRALGLDKECVVDC